ncbi:acyltransferase [Pseudochrobactrum kiredjianiae]|nr:acyltransferase [Pseudochrobactrum kiredjianiae]MDM7852720.1 acyltransferase [Pseudochrobactrum kiredjianiae]
MTFIAAGLFIATASKEISVLYLLKSMYFIVPIDPSSGVITQPVLGPGWTLNYEMFFYLIFAIFLAFPKRAALSGFTTVMLALVIWGMSTLPSSEINEPRTLFSFYANPLLLLFVAGVWLGVLYRKFALFQTANVSLLWMFIAVLCAITFNWSTDKASWPLYLQPLEYVLPFFCVVMALLCRFKPATIIGRIGVLLGEASYSIYLSHILFLAVIRKLVPVAPLYGTFYFAVAFIGSAITGVIIYKLIEMPLTRLVRKITTPQKVALSLPR